MPACTVQSPLMHGFASSIYTWSETLPAQVLAAFVTLDIAHAAGLFKRGQEARRQEIVFLAGVCVTFQTESAASDPFVFDVNSTSDEPDADVGDGLCKTAANTCTLRAAVMQANVIPNVNSTINVPAGTYKLGLPADPAKGSLKLSSPALTDGNPVISIVGAGEGVGCG
jgi:hypothetical protein